MEIWERMSNQLYLWCENFVMWHDVYLHDIFMKKIIDYFWLFLFKKSEQSKNRKINYEINQVVNDTEEID